MAALRVDYHYHDGFCCRLRASYRWITFMMSIHDGISHSYRISSL